VSDTKVVYVLTKTPKIHDMIKCHFALSMYETCEISTKICKQIVNDIAQKSKLAYLYLCVLCYCNCIIIFFITYLLLTYYILFDKILLWGSQFCCGEFIL